MPQYPLVRADVYDIVNEVGEAQKNVPGGVPEIGNDGKIPVELIPVTSGYQGGATLSTVPNESLGVQFWQATQSGTYTNMGGLIVDLADGVTYLNFDGSTWTKATTPIDLAGYTPTGGSTKTTADLEVGVDRSLKNSDPFTSESTLIGTGITKNQMINGVRAISLNGASSSVPYYISRIRKNYTGSPNYWEILFNRVSDNAQIAIVSTTVDPGTKPVALPIWESGSSGINGTIIMDWSAIPTNTNITLDSSAAVIKADAFTEKGQEDVKSFQTQKISVFKNLAVLSMIDIRDIYVINTDGIYDGSGNIRTVRLKRAFNYNDGSGNKAILQFSDGSGTTVAQYFVDGLGSLKSGIENVTVPRTGAGVADLMVRINWDALSGQITGGSTTDLKYEVREEYLTKKASQYSYNYPFTDDASIIDAVDIRDIQILGATGVLDSEGYAKEFRLKRAFNYPASNNRAYVNFSDKDGNIIAVYDAPGLVTPKSGIEDIIVSASGIGTVDFKVKINWDAISGLTTGSSTSDLAYKIKPEIVYQAASKSSAGAIYDPFYETSKKKSSAINNCQNYLSKLLNKQDDVQLVLMGDSLTARTEAATQLSASELENVPVWFSALTWPYHLYNRYVENKPVFNRFDSGIFTEVGTYLDSHVIFEDGGGVPTWSIARRDEGNRSRYSDTANASVAFAWDLSDYEKLNFIYDKDTRAANVITLSISGGNGKVQVWNGTTWVEANGYVISEYINPAVATNGSGFAQVVNKVRLRLRSISTGSVTLTFTKDSSSNYFFYWGTERWNGSTINLHNCARGGHDCLNLQKSAKDLVNYSPDLIIFQLPLINEINGYASIETILNHVHDYLWGDRVGFENANSLMNLYPTSDFMAVIPHIDRPNWQGDTPIVGLAGALNDATGLDVIYRSKALFIGRDIEYIDVFEDMAEITRINGWTLEQAFTPAASASLASFNNDDSHQNDYGHRVWASAVQGNLKY